MDVNTFLNSSYSGSKRYQPEQVKTAQASGFGAASDDYAERGIDLNEELIRNKPATFFMRVSGQSMVRAGIHHGDMVIVDRSINPRSGQIIIAVLDGDMLIRRLDIQLNRVRLIPETDQLAPIDIAACSDFQIWGVVTYVIHTLA
jgi:DNA polymerase V